MTAYADAADMTHLAGILLPSSILSSGWFSVLAAFVAINTVMYVTLAMIKTLPKIHVRDLLPRHYTRAETRSIFPDADEPGPRGDRERPVPGPRDAHDRPEPG